MSAPASRTSTSPPFNPLSLRQPALNPPPAPLTPQPSLLHLWRHTTPQLLQTLFMYLCICSNIYCQKNIEVKHPPPRATVILSQMGWVPPAQWQERRYLRPALAASYTPLPTLLLCNALLCSAFALHCTGPCTAVSSAVQISPPSIRRLLPPRQLLCYNAILCKYLCHDFYRPPLH